jgi:X-Pro dipeptidyl-peptidase
VPVVYQTSPYYAGGASTNSAYFWDVNHEVGAVPPARTSPPPIGYNPNRTIISTSQESTWVPRGFAVVHSESPGTGLSQGCPTVGGVNESLAPKAVVDWLNGRANGYTTADGDEEVEAYWATGKVGMTGTSYNGTLPLAAATTGVDGLEAIIPVAPNTSYYHYYRSNGLVRNPGGWVGEDIDYLFDYINSGDPANRQYCIDAYRVGEMLTNFDRVTGDSNDWWAGRDYLGAVDGVQAATLMAHAFNDWNVMPEHSVRISEALKARGVPVQEYFHQGGHGGNPPLSMMNRWFTRYLYGLDNDVESDARAWIVRNEGQPSTLTPYDGYPNPEAVGVRMNLQEGGDDEGGFTFLAHPGSTTETLVDDVSCNAGQLVTSASFQGNRLLYSTPELSAPLHISGTASVTIRVASSKPAANLTAYLVRLPWTSASGCNSSTRGTGPGNSVVSRSWADPQNHASLTSGEPLVPDESYDVTFDLQPDDQVLLPGTRLGLMVFSSDREFTLRPAPGTELTVDLSGTFVDLPVVGGRFAMGICEEPDPRETVVLGGVDSRVPNHTLAGICTINHHILDGAEWDDHGAFMRQVTEVTNALVASGIITGAQQGAIVAAAARSGVGK